MATDVHIFYYKGVTQMPVVQQTQFDSNRAHMLMEPYIDSETVEVGGTASSAAAAPDKTTLARVQVQDGKTIRYEVNTPARAISASSDSPRLSGEQIISFGVGWTLSLIEAS